MAAKNTELFGVEALPAVEVRSVARSAARYSLRQYDRERQAKRGRASGKARRGDGSEVSLEVSRRTWYRHRGTEP